MDMDFRFNNRNNFPTELNQDWRNGNMPLQSMFPESNFPRNIMVNFPFTRVGDNVRNTWNNRQPGDRRPRSRRCAGLNEMRNSLRRVRNEMYEAYDDFDDARAELQENRAKLEDTKHEVVEMRNGLQNAIRKLDRLVNTFSSSRMLNNLNMRERNALQRDVDNVRQDIEEARTRIRDVESDLYPSAPIEPPRNTVPFENVEIAGVAESSAEMGEPNTNTNISSTNNTSNTNNTEKTIPPYLDENNCSVCMEHPVNAVLYSCGHMCMCYSCSSKLLRRRGDSRRCPMCRAIIRDVIKIYKS